MSPGSQEPATPVLPAPAIPTKEPHWSVSLSANCPDRDRTECVAAYSFSVSSEGTFTVGPGPDGELIAGVIEDEELSKLRAYLGTSQELAFETPRKCVDQRASMDESVTHLEYNSASTEITRSTSQQFCTSGVSEETARLIEVHLKSLAQKYYPKPFPNPCTTAISSFESGLQSARQCGQDDDCVFVDDDFSPIEPGASVYVPVDDCNLLRPMIAANGFELAVRQRELISEREIVRRVCGRSLLRRNCAHGRGFNASGSRPVCSQGFCKSNPEPGMI